MPANQQLAGLLGLSRLALAESKTPEARTLCIKALRLARSRGPTTLAHYGLEAALLLERARAGEAEEALRAVGQAASNMGLSVKAALIRYALASLAGQTVGPNVLKQLVAPASAPELAPYIDWLLPHLLERASDAPGHLLAETLLQLACDFPHPFLHWFDPARCLAERRLKMAPVLALARFLPESVMVSLESDSDPALRDAASAVRARQQGGPTTPILRVHSFGPLELICGGQRVPETLWKTRKIKYLFAYLASRWGKPFSEDHIIEALWPKDNARSKNNLYWGTTTLRSALRSLNPQFDTALVRVHDSLSLHPDFPRWHDLEEFERAAAEGLRLDEAGDAEGALSRFRLVSRVYRGPYLEGCFHDFALEVRERTEGVALEVFLRAGQIALKRSDDEEAAELAAMAVEIGPHRQDAQALRMRALIRLNRGSQAIELFQKLKRSLQQEYELEPSTELLELYHRARLGYTDA